MRFDASGHGLSSDAAQADVVATSGLAEGEPRRQTNWDHASIVACRISSSSNRQSVMVFLRRPQLVKGLQIRGVAGKCGGGWHRGGLAGKTIMMNNLNVALVVR